jgi:hypothetical protein
VWNATHIKHLRFSPEGHAREWCGFRVQNVVALADEATFRRLMSRAEVGLRVGEYHGHVTTRGGCVFVFRVGPCQTDADASGAQKTASETGEPDSSHGNSLTASFAPLGRLGPRGSRRSRDYFADPTARKGFVLHLRSRLLSGGPERWVPMEVLHRTQVRKKGGVLWDPASFKGRYSVALASLVRFAEDHQVAQAVRVDVGGHRALVIIHS